MTEWIAIGLTGIGLVGSFLAVLYWTGYRLGQLELKVDTIWDFLMRRALAEGLTKGMFTQNSPLHLTPALVTALAPIVPKLLAFYSSRTALSDHELSLELDREFGDWLVPHVCVPLGLDSGACILGLIEICKNPNAGKEG